MTAVTRIVQIAPQIGTGSGVGGVALALEREFAIAGIRVERFTLAESGRRSKRVPRTALGGRLAHAWDVVWFSTVGTARARRFLAARPDAVSICHNDAMAGDIYVDHGLLQAAMRARGHYAWRMVRNPLHLFTAARDRIRYRGRAHRAFVALAEQEDALLRATYGRLGAPVMVIPNGVDLNRFRPPDAAERRQARARLALPDDRKTAIFIGHEFDRKGLPLVLEALQAAPEVTLVVVGGTIEQIDAAAAHARSLGVDDRVAFTGSDPDPVPYLWAADVFVLPSAYESSGLVFLEALACGLPVIATPVGVAPELIVDGENGWIVGRDSDQIGLRLAQLETDGPDRRRARSTVEQLGWRAIAARYLALADEIVSERKSEQHPDGTAPERLRIVHAIRSDGFSGVERFVLRLAGAQADAGHVVTVIGGDPARMRPALARRGIRHLPARRTIEVARWLRRLRAEADVVNTHMTAADLGAGMAFAGLRRRPAVISTRHFAKPRGRVGPLPIDRFLRRVIDAEISISAAVSGGIGVPSTIVHPGVDPRAAIDPASREQTVLIAQRLQPEKHTEVGLRAFALSGLADEGWTLQVAGTGPERAHLERLSTALGITASVAFLGFRSDIAELMARAGMLLAPCPFEHFGLSVVEAMAAGLPVVAADAAGHVELLGGLDVRSMFRPDDPDEAAANVRAYGHDAAGRTAAADLARDRQHTEFTLQAQASATERVYREALARQHAGTARG